MEHKNIPADQWHENKIMATFSYGGLLALNTGEARWYPPRDCTITNLEAWVSDAPVGADVEFDVLKVGVTLMSGVILDGFDTMPEQTGLSLPLLKSDYLTVNLTQIGGGANGGKNLTVRITML
jgi:hypothetical protein